MKRIIFSSVFIAIIMSAFCQIIYSQERVVQANEFNELQKKADEKLKDTPHRITMTTENFIKEKLNSSVIAIGEVVPPNKTRSLTETKIGSRATKTETIRIEEKIFFRIDNEIWKEEVWKEGKWGVNKSGNKKSEIAYKFIEKIYFNGQSAKVFESSENWLFYFEGKEHTTVVKTKYWFSEDGLLLRKESVGDTVSTNQRFLAIWIYEYNPKDLKIEAPIK